MISLIAAIARNNAIGVKNALPWHLPKDFAWFKSCTAGKAVIMGRKTFDSLGRPLPKRLNIVISRNPPQDVTHENILWATSLEHAIDIAEKHKDKWGDEHMIIGGGEIYNQSLNFADRLYLTEVDCMIDNADAFFPIFDKTQWHVTLLEQHEQEKGADSIRPAFNIMQYDRL